jgi:uncharacterized protein
MHKRILSQVWIYPVKSLGGIRLKSANVMDKGLQYDRRWMLVDEEGVFMTQRLNPKMALFKVAIDKPKEQLNFAFEQDHFSIPTHTPASPTFTAKVWEDAVEVIEVSMECSQWFSEKLNVKCRLVSFPEQNPRPVDPLYKVNGEQVSLADGYPFLIIGEQSLADLNGRLQEPVPMNRFRPNFVFTGGSPYEEDTWRDFRIGRNRFVGVKPCGRCIMTTINQDTAEQGREPLATLATYRKQGNKIHFGRNAVAMDYNEIVEGDEIIVQ